MTAIYWISSGPTAFPSPNSRLVGTTTHIYIYMLRIIVCPTKRVDCGRRLLGASCASWGGRLGARERWSGGKRQAVTTQLTLPNRWSPTKTLQLNTPSCESQQTDVSEPHSQLGHQASLGPRTPECPDSANHPSNFFFFPFVLGSLSSTGPTTPASNYPTNAL